MPSRLLILTVMLAGALALAGPAAASYGWPLAPFGQQHPIRGFFGDPRTVFEDAFASNGVDGPGSFSFHNGVDISAPDGTSVYPVVGGVVHIIDAMALSVRTFDGRTFQYFHVIPIVVEGERVFPRLTVLGYVQKTFEHVHLSELDGDRITNPLLPGHLEPYADTTPPMIDAIELHDSLGLETPPATVCGRLALDVAAFDTPSLPVPGAFAGMPVAPAVLTWQLRTLGGLAVTPRMPAVDFRKTLPPPRDFWQVYARGSYQNAPRFGPEQFRTLPGRFLYRLGELDTSEIPNGPYRVTVVAADERGNHALQSQRFWIENPPGACVPPPLPTDPPAAPPAAPPAVSATST